MNLATATHSDVPGSTNLSWLACEAANQLDQIGEEDEVDLDRVATLATVLHEATDRVKGQQRLRLTSVRRALTLRLAADATGFEGRVLQELLQHTDKIVERLRTVSPTSPRNEVSALKSFCLALSKGALLERRPVYERPGHPNRRGF